MNVSRRRVGTRCSVVAGSVWESRMKSDEVGGGVKVFRGEQGSEEGGNGATRLKRSQTGGVVATGKRKSWKLENKQIQIGRGKVEQSKNLNISSDLIKKSASQVRKKKNEGIGASVCSDKLRGPILTRRKRSEVGESFRKNKPDRIKNVGDEDGGNAMQVRKEKSEFDHAVDESRNDELAGGSGRTVSDNGKNENDENSKDFGVCLEKVISSSSDDARMVKCSPVHVGGDSHDDDDDEEEDEEDEEEVEMDDEDNDIEKEIQSYDVKKINAAESKVVNKPEKKEFVNVPEKLKTEKAVSNQNFSKADSSKVF